MEAFDPYDITPIGRLWQIERSLQAVARALELQAACLAVITANRNHPTDDIPDHLQMLQAHVIDIRRATEKLAATRRRLT